MKNWRERWRCRVPTGQSGSTMVEKFTVSKDAERWSAIRDLGRYVPAGEYTRLRSLDGIGGTTWMSDTPAEYKDHIGLFIAAEKAKTVRLHGLGLGCALNVILSMPVQSVEVVEVNSDVVSLVWPAFEKDNRVRLIVGDALEIKPQNGSRWDVVWHDIWEGICTDNLEQIATLKRRYGRRAGWQAAWAESELRYRRNQERRSGW